MCQGAEPLKFTGFSLALNFPRVRILIGNDAAWTILLERLMKHIFIRNCKHCSQ